ncbi:MAG: NB-ARC domain-containing protein [Oscillatoriaceae cyanobacterium Prado104]|jgi:hypothetical protein|nr:NB-ARC domain-containing protein [Oscillatoriaceae cyanobacterium Prado104]
MHTQKLSINSQKQKRKRGVTLTSQGFNKLQNAKSEAESDENFDKRFTLEALSDRTGLDPDTLMKVFGCKVGVDKRTLNYCFQAFNLKLEPRDYQLPQPEENTGDRSSISSLSKMENTIANGIDLSEVPDVAVFYGRTVELTRIKNWIAGDRCRLITLSGMGGTGKTSLAAKLVEQVQDNFDRVIWRSLHITGQLKDLLAEIIQFLSNIQPLETPVDRDSRDILPETVEGRILLLMNYLRKFRCLLILDGAEAILQGGDRGIGLYREGCEGYGQLFRQIGELPHQSCLLLTSREKPKEIRWLEGETLPVRSWHLKGLQLAEAQEFFRVQDNFWGTPTDWKQLIETYGGNPFVLKTVARTIKKLFDGSIGDFLKHNIAIFGDIRNFLDEHFSRLSEVEQDVINWLAIYGEAASFSELRDLVFARMPAQQLLEALESLEERSLVEKKAAVFALQPLVIEYVTHRLIEEEAEVDATDELLFQVA